MSKKEKTPEQLFDKLYLVLTGRSNYEHSGRSHYATRFGGYKFAKGSVVVIEHPEDILYFYGKKDQLTFIEMYPALPKKYAKLHVVSRPIDLTTREMQKIKKECNEKFLKSLAKAGDK